MATSAVDTKEAVALERHFHLVTASKASGDHEHVDFTAQTGISWLQPMPLKGKLSTHHLLATGIFAV